MQVLVTGSGGQLGRELLHTVPGHHQVAFLAHSDLDICNTEDIDKCFSQARPDLIINAAAYTAVDKAEQEQALAYAINVTGTKNLAHATIKYKAKLLQLSTDFVFNGQADQPYQPEDDTQPISIYGISKLKGEHEISDNTGLILRTSWLYSAHGHNFVMTMLRLMKDKKEIKVVSDQMGSPTWTQGLAKTIWCFVDKPEISGIYHWSDNGIASWYDFACAIYEEASSLKLIDKSVEIIPITSDQYPTAAKRPAYSVLDTSKTSKILGRKPDHWRTSLRAMLLELRDLLNA